MEYCLAYCFRYSWLSGEWILVAQLMPISIPMLMLFSDYKSYWYYFTTGLVSSVSLLLSYVFKVQRSNPECINFFYAYYAFPATEQVFLTSVLTMEILLVYRWNIKKILMRIFAILLIPWIYYASMVSSIHIGYMSVLFSVFLTYIILLIYSKIRRHLRLKQQRKQCTTNGRHRSSSIKRKIKIKKGICGCTSMRSMYIQSDDDDSDDDEHQSHSREIFGPKDSVEISHRYNNAKTQTTKNSEEFVTMDTLSSSSVDQFDATSTGRTMNVINTPRNSNGELFLNIGDIDSSNNELNNYSTNSHNTFLFGSSGYDALNGGGRPQKHSYDAKTAFQINSFYAIDYDMLIDDPNSFS